MFETLTFLPLERVHYGPGSVSALPGELDALDAHRALIISGRTVADETPIVANIAGSLGARRAGLFKGVRQHVPLSDVTRAAAMARDLRADLLISVGGGSAIDAAKAIAWELAAGDRPPPQIAIPTTLSAAEFSHIAGFTIEGDGEDDRSKDRRRHAALTPRAIILDAQLTVHTPAWLWASSGIRALDHAVETLYAPGEHPIQSLLALEAIRELFTCLPGAGADPPPDPSQEQSWVALPSSHRQVALRQRCQIAAWMSYFAPAAIKMGLSHVLSKSFGTTYRVPHGVTSCITLPHVMRHMAQTHAPALARMARAIGVAGPQTPDAGAALAAAGAVSDLIQRLGLPHRLRDVDVPRDAILPIARAAAGDDANKQAIAVHILQEAW